jgi:TPR repeat protein
MNGGHPIRSNLLLALFTALWISPALAQPKPATPPKPVATQPATAASTADPDPAYSAFQRGFYLSAFREAIRRATEENDPKSMTLLGELYADGLGVPNDDNKAVEWYNLAIARGNREAMFSLAMFRMTGRGGPADRKEAARLMDEAAKRGHVIAAYDLALLCLEGQIIPRDFDRAAQLMRQAAEAGNPQAQYALATFYKDGRGVPIDLKESTRWLGAAANAGETQAQVEYGIALFNGTGIAKNEAAAFPLLLKAAQKGNPIAQDRLALMYATGRGVKADPVQAARWHLIARAGGNNDQYLEDFVRKMKPADRAMAEDQAKPWIARMQPIGPTPFPNPPATQR